jgi:hypothetical protein
VHYASRVAPKRQLHLLERLLQSFE